MITGINVNKHLGQPIFDYFTNGRNPLEVIKVLRIPSGVIQ